MRDADASVQPSVPTIAPATFGAALRFWAWLGCVSFGGPAGQIALMHREIVERRRWIGERRFLHALNFAMLLPGPEAQQLATYLGWLMHRTRGGLAAGLLFVAPSFVVIGLLATAAMTWGHLPWVGALFAGVKAAVVAIVAHAAVRLARRTLRGALHRTLALAAFVAVAFLEVGFPWVVAAAALVGWVAQRRADAHAGTGEAARTASDDATRPGPGPVERDAAVPGARDAAVWLADDAPPPPHARQPRRTLLRVALAGAVLWLAFVGTLVATHGVDGLPVALATFFTQAALLTFGGAYAVLPYVVEGAVAQHGWLSAGQMMDGLALGESTPGPLIMVVAWVGFVAGWQQPAAIGAALSPLAAAWVGAAIVTFVTFLPSFVFILAGAPWVESTRHRPALAAPLAAITAAVVGVMANLALFFALVVFWPQGLTPRTFAHPDFGALALAAAALVALAWRDVGLLRVVLGSAVAGVALAALQ